MVNNSRFNHKRQKILCIVFLKAFFCTIDKKKEAKYNHIVSTEEKKYIRQISFDIIRDWIV